jgi:hydrogenase assembly chaperone HypC/HupF
VCIGQAAQVIDVERDEVALVRVRGRTRRVPLVLLTSAGETVRPGDWLLVQTGLAIARISADRAAEHIALLPGS